MEKNIKSNEDSIKKKSGKRSKKTKYIFIFLFIIIIIVLVFLYLGREINIEGTYIREISIKDEVVKNIENYLSETSYADDINVSDYVDELIITGILTIDSEGNISEEIDKNSVNICKENAQMALGEIIKKVIENRLDMLKINNDESTDDLINETLSMSLEDYLDIYGPTIFPDEEQLNETYGRKAQYFINKNSLTLKEDDKVSEYEFFKSGNKLVIVCDDEAIVYHEN